jgi:hypothetical protein
MPSLGPRCAPAAVEVDHRAQAQAFGAGAMIRSPSISIESPPSLPPAATETRVASGFSRGSKVGEDALDLAGERLAVEVARGAAGEGGDAVIDDAAPDLGEVGERRRIVGHLSRLAVGQERPRLEALGVEQRLDVAAHRLAQHLRRDDDAARLELAAPPLPEDEAVQPRFSSSVSIGSASIARAPPSTSAATRSAPISRASAARSAAISAERPGRSLTRRSQSEGWTASRVARGASVIPAPARAAHLPTWTSISISWLSS